MVRSRRNLPVLKTALRVCGGRQGGRSEISKTKRRSGPTCTRLSRNNGLKDKQTALHRKRGAWSENTKRGLEVLVSLFFFDKLSNYRALLLAGVFSLLFFLCCTCIAIFFVQFMIWWRTIIPRRCFGAARFICCSSCAEIDWMHAFLMK